MGGNILREPANCEGCRSGDRTRFEGSKSEAIGHNLFVKYQSWKVMLTGARIWVWGLLFDE